MLCLQQPGPSLNLYDLNSSKNKSSVLKANCNFKTTPSKAEQSILGTKGREFTEHDITTLSSCLSFSQNSHNGLSGKHMNHDGGSQVTSQGYPRKTKFFLSHLLLSMNRGWVQRCFGSEYSLKRAIQAQLV